jgi:guanylate kinase
MIITITGPTCSGKTTLENALVKRGAAKTVSHTTRSMRAGEVNGVDYHFVTEDEFGRLEFQGKFIEVVRFGSTSYAMSAESMRRALEQSPVVAVVAEPVGTEQIISWAIAERIPHYALWLGVKPGEQAQRFINRTMNDAMFGIGNASGAAAARLKEMLGTEQGWITRANNGSINGYHSYHHILSNGSSLTPDELAEVVMKGAASLVR